MSSNTGLYQDLDRILLTQDEIRNRVKEIGAAITKDYLGKAPIMICVLKGSVIFFSDLIRTLPLPLTTQFISVSSYGNKTVSDGKVNILSDMIRDVQSKDVILIEDIIDSGRTLFSLKNKLLTEKGAASVSIATLLDKPSRRVVDLTPDYSCFTIEDAFVVGYGLDYNEIYRNLPDIGILSPRIYS